MFICLQNEDSERAGSFEAGKEGGAMPMNIPKPMPPFKILIWSKWPKMISPAATKDNNYLGVRILFANQEGSKKKRMDPNGGGMKISEEEAEVGILLNIK